MRGEIWLADLGYGGKVRPVLVLSVSPSDDERAVVTYVPRTTSIWEHSRFDVPHHQRGMKEGAFAAQLVGTASDSALVRKLGIAHPDTLTKVEEAVRLWLDL